MMRYPRLLLLRRQVLRGDRLRIVLHLLDGFIILFPELAAHIIDAHLLGFLEAALLDEFALRLTLSLCLRATPPIGCQLMVFAGHYDARSTLRRKRADGISGHVVALLFTNLDRKVFVSASLGFGNTCGGFRFFWP